LRLIHQTIQALTSQERWEGEDGGLTAAWIAGRAYAKSYPADAKDAGAGVLVQLPWKGGDDTESNKKRPARRWAPLLYLAMWQGLRGEDLNIDTDQEIKVTCSRWGTVVTFTADSERWARAA
jgi:hypothetical protein